jgi:hypothetical protein
VRQTVHGQPEQARAYRVVPHGPHQPPHWLRATFFAAYPELPAFGRTATLGRGNSSHRPRAGHCTRSPNMIDGNIIGAFIGAAILIALALISWLWRHSTRLTKAEVQIQNNADRITENTKRTDATVIEIKQALIRIEDLVGRQFTPRRTDG